MAKFTAEQLLNHLYNKRLPHVYREADVDTKYSLKRFLQSMIEGGFTEAITSADGITDLTDPLKCPDRIFPYLFKSFGYTYSADIPIIYQRKILQNHGELFQKRGTVEYIYILTRILTGFECDVNIERVNGVRLLNVTMFVDNSVTSVESQHYVTLVKKFIKEGYIPFYLDVETNIVVDVVDIKTSDRYIASAVDVEGIIDLSPIEEVSETGLVSVLAPSLKEEPFTEFRILGYSKIVPRYINKNILNPNTITLHTNVSWIDPETKKMTTISSMDVYSDFLYVPFGNVLYFTLFSTAYEPPTVYVFVYNHKKEFLGMKSLAPNFFANGKSSIDLSSLLFGVDCESDYYVRLGIMDNEGVSNNDLYTILSAYPEEVSSYVSFNAGTRFKFDNEYYKDGESLPVYTVDVFDANGPISFPYFASKDFELIPTDQTYSLGELTLRNKTVEPFTIFTDCTTAMKDGQKYQVSFMLDTLDKPIDGTWGVPIVTALCNNGKGAIKEVILDFDYEGYDEAVYRYGYSFTVPEDYNVVRIKYILCNTNSIGETIKVKSLRCFECDPKTGNPLVESEFQPYVMSNDLNVFKNNLTIGVEGIQLLSYNDSKGKVIARDYYDVLKGCVVHNVGVNYDSLGNPTSTYALRTPTTEYVNEDLNGAIMPFVPQTFQGKTYVSMSQSIPHKRYENNGGSDYHSCVSITTRIIK